MQHLSGDRLATCKLGVSPEVPGTPGNLVLAFFYPYKGTGTKVEYKPVEYCLYGGHYF